MIPISSQPLSINEQESKTFLNDIPTSFESAFASNFSLDVSNNPFWGILRGYERNKAAEEDSTIIPQAELNKQYSNLGLTFYRDEPRGYVNALVEQKKEELRKADIIARGPQNIFAKSSYFISGLGATVLDPINIGAAFIPVVGEEQFLSSLATKSLTRARFVRGAKEGFVGNLAVEPINILTAQADQRDYTASDSLRNITFGTIVSGGLHVTFGKIGDAYKSVTGQDNIYTKIANADPALREDMIKYSLGQLAEGKKIDINNFLNRTIIAHEDNIKASADALPKSQILINLENEKKTIIDMANTIDPKSIVNNDIKVTKDIFVPNEEWKKTQEQLASLSNIQAYETTGSKRYKELGLQINELEKKLITIEKESKLTKQEINPNLEKLKTKLDDINKKIDNEKLRIGIKGYEEKIAPTLESQKITTEPKNINDKAAIKSTENFEQITPIDTKVTNAEDINILNNEAKILKEQSIIEDKAISEFNKSAKDYADVINNEINNLDKKIERQSDLLTSIKSGISCILKKGL